MNALGLGLVAALCWGLHDITIRYLSRSVPLLGALLTVLVVGALFQLGVLVASGEGVALGRRALGLSIGAGVAFLVASLGLYYAFERGPVRLVAPIIASYPILSIAFAIMTGATVTGLQGLAVLAIVAGVGIVAILSDHTADDSPAFGPTIALSIIAACGFAVTFKLGQMAAETGGELSTTLVARGVTLVLLGAIIAARRAPVFPGRKAILPLAIMGFLDGIALLAVISAAPLPNSDYAAVASSIFGLLTIVLAWVFLRERMTPGQWGGCLLTFAGVAYLAV